MTKSTTIYGIKVRTTSSRRFVAVNVRPVNVRTDTGVLVAFARVEARSDNWGTIRSRASKLGGGSGVRVVIWDTASGGHFDWSGRELLPADEDRVVADMKIAARADKLRRHLAS